MYIYIYIHIVYRYIVSLCIFCLKYVCSDNYRLCSANLESERFQSGPTQAAMAKTYSDRHMGLSENRVPSNLMVDHHPPYWMDRNDKKVYTTFSDTGPEWWKNGWIKAGEWCFLQTLRL